VSAKTYGTMSAERQKELSGLEFVQGLADGSLPLNTIAETLGYDVVEAERGRVVISVIPNDSHLNPRGTVHGGLTATRDLLEILEDRHQRASTIVTSQLPVEQWCDAIGNPTLADAILDRLVHNAHRLTMTGESMRKLAARKQSLDGAAVP